MYQTILMPIDGSACSQKAMTEGLALAKSLKAKVTFLHAVEDPSKAIQTPEILHYMPELYEAAKQAGKVIVADAVSLAEQEGIRTKSSLIENASTVDAILEAEKEADLIVIGTHGRRGFNKLLFGSVTQATLMRATKPCLIVRNT